VAALRQALLDSVTEEDVRVVSARLIEQAKTGDLAAVKLLFAYVIGRPADCVDPDSLDAQEWLLFQQAPVTEQGLQTVLGGLPVPLACQIARDALPAIQTQLAGQIAEGCRAAPQPATAEDERAAPIAAPSAPPQAACPPSAARACADRREAQAAAPPAPSKDTSPGGKPERRRAPKKGGARPDSVGAQCPECLGILPGPCDFCGRQADGAEEAALPKPAPARPALAALAALLARARSPSPNGG
jgi:hypothetical protein